MRIDGHYDGCRVERRLLFSEMSWEMPPYVVPSLRRHPPSNTLLLKAPYNVYRKNLIRKAFPAAEVSHVILTRNPAATINGLIDGWEAPWGFHKHLLPSGWWKFDLPPGWRRYTESSIPEKAWLQWHSSAEALLGWSGYWVRFEDLVSDPATVIGRLSDDLGIQIPLLGGVIPLVMATETPRPGRWKDRADTILPLLKGSSSLCSDLGYPLKDHQQWT
jgi:hypothetical protein